MNLTYASIGTELITLLAFLVSVASAFYAKRAVDIAKSANRISLHQPRAEIFKAIFDYRSLFVDMDLHPTDMDMQKFYFRAVLPAHIYLPMHFTTRMHDLYVRSRNLYEAIEKCESGDNVAESKWDYINQLQNLGNSEVEQLIHDLASELDLGNT